MHPHPHHRNGSVPALLLATAALAAFLFLLVGDATPLPGRTLDPFAGDPGMAGTFVLQAAACLVTGLFLRDPAA